MKKQAKRIWHQIPAPWRNRSALVSDTINDIQRQFEVSIGWTKKYDKYCTMEVDSERDAKMCVAILKNLLEDYVTVEYMFDQLSFQYVVRALIAGTTPHLKRMKITQGG